MNSYPSIYQVGHKAVLEIFQHGPVLIQEKIDGSQISFRHDGDSVKIRSKGAEVDPNAPGMFKAAVDAIQERRQDLTVGYTYRGEYLCKPKHNTICYERVPNGHIALFDIDQGNQDYLPPSWVRSEAIRLGFDWARTIYYGLMDGATFATDAREWLKTTSFLGSAPIEGVVVKNYRMFGPDHKVLMAKFVSADFREAHAKAWRIGNPNQGDIIALLAHRYHSAARWMKAVQHLREAGQLEGSPRDIGSLVKEVPEDLRRECEEEIREALWAWAWPKVRGKVTAGLAEWYKTKLMQDSLDPQA